MRQNESIDIKALLGTSSVINNSLGEGCKSIDDEGHSM